MKLVIIESPFKGKDWAETRRNVLYARLCIKDSLSRDEAPYASHLFFTQTGVLDDSILAERQLGIAAGIAWGEVANLRVVYQDFGISGGMKYGIKKAEEIGQAIEYRNLSSLIDISDALRKMEETKPPINLGDLLF